jgi:hypothetical protein
LETGGIWLEKLLGIERKTHKFTLLLMSWKTNTRLDKPLNNH